MKNQTKLVFIGVVFMILFSTTIVVTIFGDVEGPEIYDIAILPENPVSGDNISIVAYCIDPSGISNAQLSSTLDGVNCNIQDMEFHTCLCAAGGRWTATFGPITNSSSAAFFVTAFDSSPFMNQNSTQTLTIEL
ncbi:MAG: hypothetical protein ACW98U_11260 [Candidatus Thorarchaeota archaeon]|jgi:hypothetical protein